MITVSSAVAQSSDTDTFMWQTHKTLFKIHAIRKKEGRGGERRGEEGRGGKRMGEGAEGAEDQMQPRCVKARSRLGERP